MKENFIKSIYKTIVEEGKEEYKELLDNTTLEEVTDKYWVEALKLYNDLTEENKERLIKFI